MKKKEKAFVEKAKIELATRSGTARQWVDVMLFLTERDTFVFHAFFPVYNSLQQQFSHKRAESFDFCKSPMTSTPKSQLIGTKTATGIKSNCNVLPNPGMSPVLRKNIVMASQFRSKFNFLAFCFSRKFNLKIYFQHRVRGNVVAFEPTRGFQVSTRNLSIFPAILSPELSEETVTAVILPLRHRA
jgi:hypothetical protein